MASVFGRSLARTTDGTAPVPPKRLDPTRPFCFYWRPMIVLPGPRRFLIVLIVFLSFQLALSGPAMAGHRFRPPLVGDGPHPLLSLHYSQPLISHNQGHSSVLLSVQ